MIATLARRTAIALSLAMLAMAGAATANAQQVIGTVRDSVTDRPIAGAVLILETTAGATVARTITNADGKFAFAARGDASIIRALHIGFRPRNVALPPATTVVTSVDIPLASLGSMLDTVRVVANNKCVANGSAAQAAALLEQAREGVLATDVAAESKPADMVRATFVRQFDRNGKAMSQTVHTVANRSIDSFRAVYTGQQFVQLGFQQDSSGYMVFFAPDARTIVDPGFAAGYCFHVTKDRKRPLQVGLAFSPSLRSKDRVDIEGTLWADTAKRELRDIEFRYVGLADIMNRASPGGRIGFRALPNGVVLVDDWNLRLPVVRRDTVSSRFELKHVVSTFGPEESGGRVMSAVWPDYTWSAPMGAIEARLRDSSGALLRGAFARLDNTDYTGRSDPTGTLRMTRLLPGPYSLSVIDSAFADLHVEVPTAARFEAVADSVTRGEVTVAAPLEGVVAAYCPHGLAAGHSSIVVGRLYGSDAASVVSGGVVLAAWGPVSSPGQKQVDHPDTLQVLSTTNDDGVFAFCGLPEGTAVSLSAVSGTDKTGTSTIPMPNSRKLIRRDLYLLKPQAGQP